MKMISMASSPEKDSTMDSPRSTSSMSTPTFGRKSRSRKKHKRDKSLDRISLQSSRSTSLTRHSIRSMGAIFPKSWKDSFRRKEDASPSMQRKDLRSELSTEECAPGVLKVFGNSVTPGAEYKSVLATQSSTSQELIKEALERYGISRRHAGNFVLCDVIGHLGGNTEEVEVNHGENKRRLHENKGGEDPVWTEQCVRVVGDYERPLTLQLYWKPMEGYSRRFEIRKRYEIQTREDTITSRINANARRMLLAKIKPTALPTDNLYYQIKKDSEDDEAGDTKATLDTQNGGVEIDLLSNVTHRINNRGVNANESSHTHTLRESMNSIPDDSPYLLTIKHFNGDDLLLHKFQDNEITIGNNHSSSITLFAPDVAARHCVLYTRKQRNSRNGNPERNMFCIRAVERALVCVNSKQIFEETALVSYDLISIGEHYTFVFKNPFEKYQKLNENKLMEYVQNSKPAKSSQIAAENGNFDTQISKKEKNEGTHINNDMVNNNNKKLTSHKNVEKSHPLRSTHENISENVKESREVVEWRLRRNVEYERDSTRLKIRYQKEQIDSLLDTVINLGNANPNMYRLCPSYLLCMCVEYSAVKFEQATTRRLLLKMVNLIENEVWVRVLRSFYFS